MVQVDEDLDLGAQDLGHDRREDVVDRAERIAARRLHLVGVRGDEDDRRVRRALVLADQRRGLEAVDVGHVDVEQDDRELAPQDLRSASLPERTQTMSCPSPEHPGDQQLLGQIVDDRMLLARQVVDDAGCSVVGPVGDGSPGLIALRPRSMRPPDGTCELGRGTHR